MTGADSSSRVAVFGLGYVGCVTAACLASTGHKVIGIDPDRHKTDQIQDGRTPFYEPGLEEIVRATVRSGHLAASNDATEALRGADIALICVGTPSEHNGNLDLSQVKRVVRDIRANVAADSRLIVCVRSTVFPGTCEEIVIPELAAHPHVKVVSNPEFLREGCAVRDFMEPSLLVVGGPDAASVQRVASLYSSLDVEPCLVSLRTAEMIKYACNAFHAVKIAFANEIGTLAGCLQVNGHEVMETLCQDRKLNASAAYLKPGFAFGGSCLPKDLRALSYRASRQDLKLPLLEAALPSNDEHLDRAVKAVLSLPGRVGVIGLAFKEDTDDLRESPIVRMLESLLGKGRDVRVYDPHIRLDSIYGSNRNYIMNAIPHIGRLLEPEIGTLLNWADRLVIAQKPNSEMASRILASGRPALDLVGALPAAYTASETSA